MIFWTLTAGAVASACMAVGLSHAESSRAKVTLTRLDCGTVQVNDLNVFSDTDAYAGQKRQLVASCYLIRHGDTVMIWDTGLPAALKGAPVSETETMSPTLTRTLVEQLADLGIKPEQVSLIGISHYHFDHIGQAASFPKARLLIGAADHDALKAGTATFGDPAMLAPWLKDGAPVERVAGDKDIFGDGSVRMLAMPGHTPGHMALLVRLQTTGNVLLTGDLAHFQANYDSNGVPDFNTDRADSLAALDRFKRLAGNIKATVIIQHEPGDVTKLPAFPKAAD